MNQGIKSRIRRAITGLTLPQEYCCVMFENFRNSLEVVLTIEGREFRKPVTESHVFLGYTPLIIGIVLGATDRETALIRDQTKIQLDFEDRNATTVATLTLVKISERTIDQKILILYRGEYGAHSFISSLHQKVNRHLEKIGKKGKDNIDLPGNLADQVRIAYSIPRKISVITVSDGKLVNLFPTDLHGKVADRFYMSSLRLGGKANEQVERQKKIVIADVDSSRFRETYALGKNHMKDLRPEKEFDVASTRSATFDFPLLEGTVRYKELRQMESIELGIHRIHFYEIVAEVVLDDRTLSLAHVHRYYAQWRMRSSDPINILFR